MDEIGGPPDDFARAFESSFAHLQIRIEEACAKSDGWPRGVAAAIHAAFEFAAEDPTAAAALTRRALGVGADGIARHRRLLAYLADKLAPGRELAPDGRGLPTVTEQALAGGLAGLVAERLVRDGLADLPALAPEAIQFALTPYIGVAEARRIAEGPQDDT